MKLSSAAIRNRNIQYGQPTPPPAPPVAEVREKISLRSFSTDRNVRANNGINIPNELRERIAAQMTKEAISPPAAFSPWGFL